MDGVGEGATDIILQKGTEYCGAALDLGGSGEPQLYY
jgi:hypothetical protein